jgi:hypothetical protein
MCEEYDQKPKGDRGLPTALDDKGTHTVAAIIRSSYNRHNYVGQRGALSFIETDSRKCLMCPSMSSFLKAHQCV